MVIVNSWGRLMRREHDVAMIPSLGEAPNLLKSDHLGLPFGMGRSYGDSCLNPGALLWKTSSLDKFIQFDSESGTLTCEAGVCLRDIQRTFVSRGWMLPVTPGTQMVSVGGAIANDVHGKNHHVYGSFGDQVVSLTLLRTDGQIIEANNEVCPDWFAATVGGLGLTGVILKAKLQLRRIESPWLESETIPYHSVEEFFDLANASESGWEHTVSWIDCVNNGGGRGIFLRANHSSRLSANDMPKPVQRERTMPFVPPVSLVNKLSLKPFNVLYFQMSKWRAGRNTVHYEPFFYPLDNLLEWNRMYGPKGFFQYQSVVPFNNSEEVIKSQLKEISRSGEGSFLAVLKTFGKREARGMLSFPQPGVTLALDFPNKGTSTLKLFERLDAIVGEAGGRIYPAKDARMPAEMFQAGYPRLNEFLQYRDPGISSAMSRRLMGS